MEQDKTMTSTASTQQTLQQQQPHKVIVTDDSVEEEKKVADKENKPGIKANVKEEPKQFASDIKANVEKATRALSVQHRVKMKVESIIYGSDFSETLTRAKFENLNMDLFRGTLKPVQKVLEDAAKIVATILDKIKILYDNNRLSPEDIERMVNNVEKLADCGEDNESRLILKTIATMLGKLLRRTSPTTDDPVIQLDDQPGPSYK
uniref:Uncharacterized protein n=1 Tax=Meloidogyne floridensis TaxID=298350 RepID=A0A915P3I9_9BILA